MMVNIKHKLHTCTVCGRTYLLTDENILKGYTTIECSHCANIFQTNKDTTKYPGPQGITNRSKQWAKGIHEDINGNLNKIEDLSTPHLKNIYLKFKGKDHIMDPIERELRLRLYPATYSILCGEENPF